ncbi:hypothetical protein [Methylocapsa palsarum]|uniref:Protamine-2 (Modular protein) n=1 Tax=Methylocapsa palsarum TaxID=1612308 RepID=A0A1I3W1Y9_9HYPH|nr:hypothetical protein [Methylocapsa palsarum]SFK01495.1 hypothetical protein SAMN05444581_101294 [Methylocapsa palsarum]
MLSRRTLLSGFFTTAMAAGAATVLVVSGSTDAEAVVNPHRHPRAIAVNPHSRRRRSRHPAAAKPAAK